MSPFPNLPTTGALGRKPKSQTGKSGQPQRSPKGILRVPCPTREAGSQGRHGSEFRSVSLVKEIWTQKTKKEVSNEANL
jgi:hypothetical protein